MSNIIKENRIGKFYIKTKLLKNEILLVREVLSKVLIIRAKNIFARETIEYVGYCKQFDKVKEGEKPPEYEVIVNNFDENWYLHSIKFKRLN